MNENRKVVYQKAKKWVQDFNSLNGSLKASNKPLFTPTTVMEIGNSKYLFIIYDAKLNSKGRIVFKVSTEEIELSSGTSKKMLKLPCGHHDGVRFDIDPFDPIDPNDSYYSCFQIKLFMQSLGYNCAQYNCGDNLGNDVPSGCADAIWRGCGNQYSWNDQTILPVPVTYINCL